MNNKLRINFQLEHNYFKDLSRQITYEQLGPEDQSLLPPPHSFVLHV